jgi:hypothetical protein
MKNERIFIGSVFSFGGEEPVDGSSEHAGKFLGSCTIDGFSRRAQLNE